MLNKPAGYVTAKTDARRPTVMTFFPPDLAEKLHPIGRLDMDTHGILLFTDDGMLDQALLPPDRHVEKTYVFYALGEMTAEKIRAIGEGVTLGNKTTVTRPAEITVKETCRVREIEEFLPPLQRKKMMRNPDGAAFRAELTIREGRKHQVKLMMRAVGCLVCTLWRVSFAGIPLDPALPEGAFRPLTAEELAPLLSRREIFLREREERLKRQEETSETV